MTIRVKKISLICAIYFWLWFAVEVLPNSLFHIAEIIRVVLPILPAYSISTSKNKRNSMNRIIPGFVILYCLLIIVSTIVSYSTFYHLFQAIGEASCFIGILLFCEYCVKKDSDGMLNGFYFAATLTALVNLFSVMLFPEGLTRVEAATTTVASYFTGGKFSVLYIHIIWMLLYLIKENVMSGEINYMKFTFIATLGILEMIIGECNQGILAIIIFYLSFFFFNKGKKVKRVIRSNRKKSRIVFILVIGIILFSYLVIEKKILDDIPIINYLMYTVLDKADSIGGRYRIYSNIFSVIKKSWLFGYGYGNNVIYSAFKLQNAQNGFLNIWVDYGLLALISFIATIIILYRRAIVKSRTSSERSIVVCTLIFFLLLSVLEIPFKSYFYFCTAFVYYICNFKLHSSIAHEIYEQKNITALNSIMTIK